MSIQESQADDRVSWGSGQSVTGSNQPEKGLKKVVAFVPSLNEEETVGELIDQVNRCYPLSKTRLRGYFVEILVVNDGSTDRTEEIAIQKGVQIVNHPTNLGLGAATRTGMQTALEMGASVALKLDADIQHDPKDLEEVILPILEDRADICWGSRFAGSINYKMPLIRLWGNKFFTWLMSKLTSYEISDAQTGLMAFGRKYLEKFEIHGNYNPPQQLLIDANCKSMRYTEVPVNFDPRVTGESFVSAKYPFCVLMNILRILVYANPLRVFSYIGLSFMSLSVLYFLFTNIGLKMGWDMTIFIIENLSLALLMIGLQAFFFGLLADMIMKKRS